MSPFIITIGIFCHLVVVVEVYQYMTVFGYRISKLCDLALFGIIYFWISLIWWLVL